MPHASHRLDLVIVPQDLEQTLHEATIQALFESWGVDSRGHTGKADQIVAGGCRRIWLDQPGRLWLYGNQSGGFRVQCPRCQDNISAAFGRAHRAWKQGSERVVECPSCGSVYGLEDCDFRPPAAFAHWAIVFADVGSGELQAEVSDQLTAAIGAFQVIIRRP